MSPSPPTNASGSELSRRLRGLVHDAACTLPPLSSITGAISAELEKTPVLGVILLRSDMFGRASQLFAWSDIAKVYGSLERLAGSLIGSGLRRVDLPVDLGLAGDAVIVVLSAPREDVEISAADLERVVARLRTEVDTNFGDDLAPGIRERLQVEIGHSLLRRPENGHTLDEELLGALASADTVATAAYESSLQMLGEELAGILEGDGLSVEYQPIIELSNFSLAGFECFVHGPQGSRLERGDVLLDVASRVGQSSRAYDSFHKKALEQTAGNIAPNEMLVLGVTAEDLLAGAVRTVSRLYLLPTARLTPTNILFLVDSRSVFERFPSSLAAFESVSDMGFRLGIDASLDDPFPLDFLRELKPDILRLRGRSVMGLADHSDEFELVFMLTRFAARHNMRVHVVGCSDTRELEALRRAEIDLVQGDLFGEFAPFPNRAAQPSP
jgi:EAL domain-containing protein (putative c-di-GMP-specific phosphodiesterase class I)